MTTTAQQIATQQHIRPTNATPTEERAITSYPPRRAFHPYIVNPPEVPGVKGAIDIHCHAHFGQQDALSLAKLASVSQMSGILYKSLGKRGEPPMQTLHELTEALNAWADENGETPITCWAGWALVRNNRPPDLERVEAQLKEGIAAIWLPIANSAFTLSKIGGRESSWNKNADPRAHSAPLPWDEAVKCGFYMLDDNGKLKHEYAEAIRMAAHYNRAVFFGHPTKNELWAVADLLTELGHRRAVIDHPFSPLVDLTVEEMHQVAARGIYLNFTYDELSPLLGVDPKKMYEAIRAVGPEHFTLSSDAGEPLFPNSAECMRLICGYMLAFGCTAQEIETMVSTNPRAIVGA